MKILILHARALHLGYLGCYGNEWAATPHLDRLASQGMVFDQHFVNVPDATEEFEPAAAFSGLSTKRGRSLAAPQVQGFADRVGELLPWLGESGSVLAWVEGPDLSPPWRLDADLAIGQWDDGGPEPWPDPPQGIVDVDDDALLRLQDTYAAVVTAWDAELGRILNALAERGLRDSTLVIVTARHGLPLGEHGLVGFARPWLHEELVHVPLVMCLPGQVEAGRRFAALTQPGDLDAAIQEWLQPAEAALRPPRHLLREDSGELDAQVVSSWRLEGREEWALRTKDWALLWPRTTLAADPPRPVQLYAKPDDRWEVNNVCQHHWELVESWQGRLEELARGSLR